MSYCLTLFSQRMPIVLFLSLDEIINTWSGFPQIRWACSFYTPCPLIEAVVATDTLTGVARSCIWLFRIYSVWCLKEGCLPDAMWSYIVQWMCKCSTMGLREITFHPGCWWALNKDLLNLKSLQRISSHPAGFLEGQSNAWTSAANLSIDFHAWLLGDIFGAKPKYISIWRKVWLDIFPRAYSFTCFNVTIHITSGLFA